MDRRSRTIIKTLTWRLLAIVITWIVVYLFNKDLIIALEISISANILKTVFYYFHERIWNRISFGRKKEK